MVQVFAGKDTGNLRIEEKLLYGSAVELDQFTRGNLRLDWLLHNAP